MATPYFQLRLERVPSTQDVARERVGHLPLLVLATGQSEGRGRSGAEWMTADRALAASIAVRSDHPENRPLSLMAGIAAVRVTPGTTLKWPNDVLIEGSKTGGILVEHSAGVTVIGLGLNLWWPSAGEGLGALFEDDPGEDAHAGIGALWAAELMQMWEGDGWPIEEYLESCGTIGADVTWEPGGSGRAVDVAEDGALLVETPSGIEAIYSGAVRHLRVT